MPDTQPIPDEALCPACGAEPTEDSVVENRLSDLGYLHEDVALVCTECGNRWQLGLPRGDSESYMWVCDACADDLIPHFVYVYPDEEVVRIRPKCQACNWVPDEPIEVDCSTAGDTIRFFVGHHTVTGNRNEAEPNPL